MNSPFRIISDLLSNKTQGVLTMKKFSSVLLMLIIVGLLISAVSAEMLIDEGSKEVIFEESRHYSYNTVNRISIFRIQDWDGLYFVYMKTYNLYDNSVLKNNPYYDMDVTLMIENNVVGTGTAHYNALFNSAGNVIGVQVWLDIDSWNNPGYTGMQTVRIIPSSGTLFNGLNFLHAPDCVTSDKPIGFCSSGNHLKTGAYIARASYYWENDIDISDKFVSLTRELNGKKYVSTLEITSDAGSFTDTSSNNINVPYAGTGTWKVTNPYGREYSGLLVSDKPGEPDGIPINIRVQNSQTGALLANSHITISASVNGEFHEVVNETIPAGTKTYYLQPTGGGLPNPDFYRLFVAAEGYNSIMPYNDFEADIPTTIYAYMNPIGGAPVNENKTFIDFYVRDLNAKPVSGATVKFGPYTLLTNSAGYTIFEVDKDTLYVWTVSKAGYESVTGNIVVGSDARYTINAVISPAVTPIPTTPIPTTPVKPSPTLTGPTGEPVSNLLEWSAAHFGMLLGGGLEIGKIFMWLCFTIPAGVYVGKQAKAGAAGFMAGAGIVTLFFVIIGWVPIWLVVILSLIIGLLYAKAFSNIGNGGGR